MPATTPGFDATSAPERFGEAVTDARVASILKAALLRHASGLSVDGQLPI